MDAPNKSSHLVSSKSRSRSSTKSVSRTVNLFEGISDSQLTEEMRKSKRSLYAECGMDQRCQCFKSALYSEPPRDDSFSWQLAESADSDPTLDARLTAVTLPLSATERRLSKSIPVRLFKNRVDRMWHKRYNYTLPEDQQFDLQPFDEIQHRDEEIALEYFYGDAPPFWLLDGSKEAQDSRARILNRYNKEKRLEEEAQSTASPAVIHTRVESIISVNRTRAADTASVFGPSASEKAKTSPVVAFMEKLVRLKIREKERSMLNLSAKSKWHFMRRASTLDDILKMVEAEKKIRARQKFRRTIKVVRAVVRFIRVISIMSRDARHVLTEIHYFQENQRLQTQQKINDKINSGHVASRDVFDPNKYRFSSRFKISNEIRMILTKPWNVRSDAEVNKVVERLQELRCFVEYPVSFQHKLARLAWLIEVAADLAIIREGHIAADFYFMLAGKAKMIALHGSPCLTSRGTFHTLRHLKNGDAFGDESMSHPDSERTYSVITTEKSILLSLSSVDYVSMLLQTRDDEQAPEHIIFLSTLAFLNDFPKQKLIEEGDEYIRNYYLRAGSVISEALSESEYIYVVKYGSCRVLVEIPPTGSQNRNKRRSTMEAVERRTSVAGVVSEKLYVDRLKQSKSRIGRISSVMEFLHNHKDEIANNPNAMTALKNMRSSMNDKEFQQAKSESENFLKKSKKMFRSLRADTILSSDDPALRSQSKTSIYSKGKRSTDEESMLREEEPLSRFGSQAGSSRESFGFQGSTSSDQSIDVQTSTSSKLNIEKHLSFIVSPSSSKRVAKNTRSSSFTKHAVGTNIEMEIDLDRTYPPSFSPLMECSERNSFNTEDPQNKVKLPDIAPKADVNRKGSGFKYSKWKLVKTMVKGDYIGHEWVNLNRGPFEPPDEEMSMVSDGCEVIMMHREFLIKYLRKEL